MVMSDEVMWDVRWGCGWGMGMSDEMMEDADGWGVIPPLRGYLLMPRRSVV